MWLNARSFEDNLPDTVIPNPQSIVPHYIPYLHSITPPLNHTSIQSCTPPLNYISTQLHLHSTTPPLDHTSPQPHLYSTTHLLLTTCSITPTYLYHLEMSLLCGGMEKGHPLIVLGNWVTIQIFYEVTQTIHLPFLRRKVHCCRA